MPLVSAASPREPDLIHTPMATDRKWSMRSVRTIRPLGSTVRRRLRSIVIVYLIRFNSRANWFRTTRGIAISCARDAARATAALDEDGGRGAAWAQQMH